MQFLPLSTVCNASSDNIGARRLHTVLERILSDISFSAPQKAEEAKKEGKERFTYLIDEAKVAEVMTPLLKKQDLSKYVL